ncbi:MAG: citrate (Si)-synthase [Planctomycetota bacterium]|nr:MAG: citrate (Si)-synthase [Planctomycetota bacterium]
MAKELFVITEDHLNTGLRGFPVGTVRTSKVDPEKGVSYVGYPIRELVDLDPEQVMYLLLNKDLPTPEEDKKFREELKKRSVLPEGVMDFLKTFPKQGHPMEWFMGGLLALGMFGKVEDYKEDGLNLLARVPQIVAAIFRLREGWGDPIPPRDDLGYVENFVHMLDVPGGSEHLPEVMRLFHILHMDHGGGNLSTFTGKAVASGLADIYASMAAAMAGLYGPRHGRANQDCLRFVQELESDDDDYVRSFIQKKLENKELIYGFGHAVLRAEDPRAAVQYDVAARLFPEDENVRKALKLRKIAVEVLKQVPKIANPYPNVDAVSGSLLHASGLKKPEYYTVLFGFSRVVGITAQIIDERLYFRNGKGVPIYRCKYLPENQPERHLEKKG